MSPITDWESLAKDAKEANTSFEPAPEANYNLSIIEVVPDIAKDSGNQKFTATMVIDSGPYKGKRLWHDFVVARGNKKALSIFFQNMAVLGMPYEFFNANTQNEQIVANMLHKRVSADLIVDKYNPEKPKNKIDKGWTIKAPTGPAEIDAASLATNANSGQAAVTNAPPPQPTYQQPPQQYQEQPPVVYQQPAQQYPLANAAQNMNTDVDPWQTPQAPPPPPSNASWGAPPPAPPGLNPTQ